MSAIRCLRAARLVKTRGVPASTYRRVRQRPWAYRRTRTTAREVPFRLVSLAGTRRTRFVCRPPTSPLRRPAPSQDLWNGARTGRRSRPKTGLRVGRGRRAVAGLAYGDADATAPPPLWPGRRPSPREVGLGDGGPARLPRPTQAPGARWSCDGTSACRRHDRARLASIDPCPGRRHGRRAPGRPMRG